jgi:hypothetical protein
MVLVIALALLAGLLPIFVTGKPSHGAGTLPDGFEQSRLVGELTNPTAMAFAPDGSLFVAEQRGTLRVVDANGQLQETPFLDARGSARAASGASWALPYSVSHCSWATSVTPTRRATRRTSRLLAQRYRTG